MQQTFKRLLANLDLEDRILAAASLFAFVSVFLPWMSGQWLSEEAVSYSGIHFFTSYIGMTVALCMLAVFVMTIVPAAGGQLPLKRRQRETLRSSLAILAAVLTLAALSVLINVTYDYTRMDIRFGIYATFAGSIVSAFYAFWKLQEFRKSEPHEVFHHPEEMVQQEDRRDPFDVPPPPPPPPPLAPEDYKAIRR
jgi:hypothetical protein